MTGRMIGKVILIGPVCFGLIFLSCASAQIPAPTIKGLESSGAPGGGAVPQQGWEQDWQKTLAAAKKEGLVSIYSPAAPPIRQAFSQVFKDKFGLDIEWTAGRAEETVPKLLRERQAGLYLADAFMGGTSIQINVLKPSGVLDPLRPVLVLPEVLNEKAWYGGRLPFLDKEQSYIITGAVSPSMGMAINTNMVRPEDLSSYDRLLEPRWKAKVVLDDPIISGGGYAIFTLFMVKGPDYLRKLAAQDPIITNNWRLAAEWLAQGRYPIFMGSPRLPAIKEFIDAGAPIRYWTPPDGASLTAGVSIGMMNRAPHLNAVKIYVNWFLTKEPLEIFSRLGSVQSSRLDVPTDHLSPEERLNPSVSYFNATTEEVFLKVADYQKAAKEIFGPLMK
ncbi:MAG: extracellular solute-binding protein [Chloroflexi bacterium]|nr:extracellular solute-binding protein [Chloroflexota bacterium]